MSKLLKKMSNIALVVTGFFSVFFGPSVADDLIVANDSGIAHADATSCSCTGGCGSACATCNMCCDCAAGDCGGGE